MRNAMLRSSCQALRTLPRRAPIRRRFFRDARNPCELRTSCMLDTRPTVWSRCDAQHASALLATPDSDRNRPPRGYKKYFCTTARNRVVGDPMAMRIARIARIGFGCASPHATAKTTVAERKCVSKRPQHDFAPTIRAHGWRIDVAIRSVTRPNDTAEAISVGNRAVDATGCDDSAHRE